MWPGGRGWGAVQGWNLEDPCPPLAGDAVGTSRKGQPGVGEEASGVVVRGVAGDEVRSGAGGAHGDGEELGFYCMRIRWRTLSRRLKWSYLRY